MERTYLTVIAFKNGKQQLIRRNSKVELVDLTPNTTHKWIDCSTGAVILFNSNDVNYVSQVDEKITEEN